MEIYETFNHCPLCSEQLNHEGRLITCSHCEFHYYINSAPCNAVIITNEIDELMLVRRKFDPSKGLWDLPGGFVEYDETFEDSVVRELQEELNTTASNLRYVKSYTDIYHYKGLNYHTLCTVFTATIDPTQIQANDDVSEVRFFKKNEIPMEQLAFPSIKKVITEYLAQ